MPLPDSVTARIRRSLEELLSAELGTNVGALQDVMRPILKRAFERGVHVGVTLTAAASGQGIESFKAGLIEELGPAPAAPVAAKPLPHRPRIARASKGGKPRAAAGSVGQAIDLVLADQPGLRIVDIQNMAVELDPAISRSSVTNELRRKVGTRYRKDGTRWFRIGDQEKGAGLAPRVVVPDPLVGGPEAATAVSGPPASRAA